MKKNRSYRSYQKQYEKRAGSLSGKTPRAGKFSNRVETYHPTVGNMNVPSGRKSARGGHGDRGLYIAAAAAFLAPLVVLGGISVFDTDATVSEQEKRTLKTRPELTAQALFSGSYTKDFEEYYADTFPFRNFFLKINDGVTRLFTKLSNREGIVLIQKENNPEDFGGEALTEAESDGASDNATETDAAPPEPTRPDDNVDVKEKGNVILMDNRIMELYSINREKLQAYAASINRLADKTPDTQFYVLLAPTSVEFYAPGKFSQGSHSQKQGIELAYAALSPKVKTVDAYSELSAHTADYLYFRTDHHWTARGAYYGYAAFARQAGFSVPPLESYPTGRIDDFLGSLKSYAQGSQILNEPDYVEYFEPHTAAHGEYFSDATMTDGKILILISKKINDPNKYLAFIQGDTPLCRIRTENKNGKKILVVKESYGNAFVPYLVDQYEEIYVVDPRKVKGMNLPAFLRTNGIQEALLINYAFAPSNAKYMSSLDEIIGP